MVMISQTPNDSVASKARVFNCIPNGSGFMNSSPGYPLGPGDRLVLLDQLQLISSFFDRKATQNSQSNEPRLRRNPDKPNDSQGSSKCVCHEIRHSRIARWQK